ncbi:Putative pwwp domain-containing protein [Gryllus bimaculatus]|nr:Putative pwwp domain-containing protein [Gryllus bimaculatus]
MKETKLIQVQPADLSELNRVIDWEVQFLLVERPKREAVVVAGRCRAGAWRAAQPGGVYSSAAATAAGSPRDGDEDRLYSVGQRFSYFGVGRAPGPAAGAGRRRAAAPFAPAARRGARPRATRRPRMTCGCAGARVLLKCRSNLQRELGERGPVGGRPGGRGRGSARLAAPGPGRPGQPPGAGAAGDPGAEDPAAAVVETRRPSPRPLFSENQRDNQPRMGSPPGQGDGKLCTTTLIPKLSRLQSAHSPAARQRVAAAAGGTHKISWWAARRHPLPAAAAAPPSVRWRRPGSPRSPAPSPDGADGDADDSDVQVCGGAGGRMVLRKKRSVGSMEDLWDESVFEAEAKRARAAPSPTFALGPAPPATPVIKISFGRQNPVTLLCP